MLSELRRDGVVSAESHYLLGHRTAAEHVLLEDEPQRRAAKRKGNAGASVLTAARYVSVHQCKVAHGATNFTGL